MEEKSVKQRLDELSNFLGKLYELERMPYKEVLPELKKSIDKYRGVLKKSPYKVYESMKFLQDIIYLAGNVEGFIYNTKEWLKRNEPKGEEKLYVVGMELAWKQARYLQDDLYNLKMFAEKHKKYEVQKKVGLMILILAPFLSVFLFSNRFTGFSAMGSSGLMGLKLAIAVIAVLAAYFLGKSLKSNF